MDNRRKMDEREKFFKKVDKQPKGCWLWTGALNKSGAGIFWARDKSWLAHRLSCVLHGLPMQSWHCAFHVCQNRRCVNPEHVRLMTRAQFNFEVSRMPPKPGLVRVRLLNRRRYRVAWLTPEAAAAVQAAKAAKRKKYCCKNCDKLMSTRYMSRKYCSDACRWQAYRATRYPPKPCARCQKPIPFEKQASCRRKHCSRACAYAANSERLAFINPNRRKHLLRNLKDKA